MLRRLLRRSLRIKLIVKMILMKIRNVLREIFYQNAKKKYCKMLSKRINKIKDLQDLKS
jgi:hypothetical protein